MDFAEICIKCDSAEESLAGAVVEKICIKKENHMCLHLPPSQEEENNKE